VLNYETIWMNRDQIAEATYEAGLRLNRLKARYGLIEPAIAEATERRHVEALWRELQDAASALEQ
jgi:hypothetical protein